MLFLPPSPSFNLIVEMPLWGSPLKPVIAILPISFSPPMIDAPFNGYNVFLGRLASPKAARFLHRDYLLAKRLDFSAVVYLISAFETNTANDMSWFFFLFESSSAMTASSLPSMVASKNF